METTTQNGKLYKQANFLAVFTIIYNLIEGVVSMWFGASDETLALFGFGVDSFIEVISAVAVVVKEVVAFVSNAKPLFSTPGSHDLCCFWNG